MLAEHKTEVSIDLRKQNINQDISAREKNDIKLVNWSSHDIVLKDFVWKILWRK